MNIEKLAAKQLIDTNMELEFEVEEAFDYSDSLNEAIYLIETLKKNSSQRNEQFVKELVFQSDKWIFYNVVSGHDEIFDFANFEVALTFVNHIEIGLLKNVAKCWVLHRLVNDELSPTTVTTYFNYLSETIILTQAFREDQVDILYEFIQTLKLADGPKRQRVITIINFLSYFNYLDIDFEYTQKMYKLLNTLKVVKKSRLIPSGKDILRFSKILEDFFEKSDKTSKSYIHFFPLLLWWKITTVIPLRPFEFCDIGKDCLDYNNDNKCYLLLPRLKGPHKKTKNRNRKQIVDRILLPNYIESIIKEYLEIIEPFEDNDRKTLISRLVYEKTLIKTASTYNRKRANDRFLTPDLSILINRFYNEIVDKNYGLKSIKLPPIGRKAKEEKKDIQYDLISVRAIDSRHIAFINMLAQGWAKPEIARFGGHLVLETQETYQNHREYWIEEETQKMMSKFRLGCKRDTSIRENDNDNENDKTSDSISFSMRLDAAFKKKFILRPPATDTNKKLLLGYCTDPLQDCKTDCIYCDFWRITQVEFDEKTQELRNFIRECDYHIHELFAFLKDLFRFLFVGELNIKVATQILSTQKEIDEQIFKRSSFLYNLEKSHVEGN